MSECTDGLDTMRTSCAPSNAERREGAAHTPMASDKIVTLTDGNFDSDVIGNQQPVLVDFWAEWCGPCRALAPAIDALATDYAGKVSVGKLNVDENPEVTMRFMVRGIPTVMLFKGGKVVDQVVGLVDKGSLKQMVDRHT
jgi:thioredoxin 1